MWKGVERRYAQLLGGERIPVSGRGSQSDVITPSYSVEVKSRQKLPAWLVQIRSWLQEEACLLLYTKVTELPPFWLVCCTRMLLSGQIVIGRVVERRSIPEWILKAVRQSVSAAQQEGRIPLVVIHEHGSRYEQDICILPEVERCNGVSYAGSILDPSDCTSPRKASRQRSEAKRRDSC